MRAPPDYNATAKRSSLLPRLFFVQRTRVILIYRRFPHSRYRNMSLKRRTLGSLSAVMKGSNELVGDQPAASKRFWRHSDPASEDGDAAAKRCRMEDSGHDSSSGSNAASDDGGDAAGRYHEEDGTQSPSAGTCSRRKMARVAAEVAGLFELVTLLHSLPRCDVKLDETTELALLELNILLKRQKRCDNLGVKLISSHSWTRNRTQKIVASVASAVPADPAITLVHHLVNTTYPRCSAAAAAKHVFEAPPWLQTWCERYRVEANNVVVLELMLFDAVGRVSNPLFFPLLGRGEHAAASIRSD